MVKILQKILRKKQIEYKLLMAAFAPSMPPCGKDAPLTLEILGQQYYFYRKGIQRAGKV